MAMGRTGRLATGIGAAALLLLAGGWALAWRWAAAETAQTLDDWMAREARVGRHWACPGRAVSGFPVHIRRHLSDGQLRRRDRRAQLFPAASAGFAPKRACFIHVR